MMPLTGLPYWHVNGIEGILESKVNVYLVQFLQQRLLSSVLGVSNHHELDACIITAISIFINKVNNL